MNKQQISSITSIIDYSILWQNCSQDSIEKRCKEALDYGFACIACLPAYVSSVKKIVDDQLSITAAVGFPLGGSTTKSKIYEALDAIDNGANEIDVVMNIAWFKDGLYNDVLNELRQITNQVKNKKSDCVVKVIIETPHLKKYHELKKACELVIESGADFVKEATGFAAGYDGTGVASYSDDEVDSFDNTGIETIKHIYDIVEGKVKIKPSGDLKNLEECLYCVEEFKVERIGNDFIPQWLEAQNK